MKAYDIYKQLQEIIEPIHAHDDQMNAIAHWIESEFEYKSAHDQIELKSTPFFNLRGIDSIHVPLNSTENKHTFLPIQYLEKNRGGLQHGEFSFEMTLNKEHKQMKNSQELDLRNEMINNAMAYNSALTKEYLEKKTTKELFNYAHVSDKETFNETYRDIHGFYAIQLKSE